MTSRNFHVCVYISYNLVSSYILIYSFYFCIGRISSLGNIFQKLLARGSENAFALGTPVTRGPPYTATHTYNRVGYIYTCVSFSIFVLRFIFLSLSSLSFRRSVCTRNV
uniref:Uncharacterized protein n=1 Tax=Octopus bimaculoides TaxID=37653 RepID=A0A0L8HHB9_OCTBM